MLCDVAYLINKIYIFELVADGEQRVGNQTAPRKMEAVENADERREHQEARKLQSLRQYRLCGQNN